MDLTKELGPIVVLIQNYRPKWDSRAIRPRLEKLHEEGWEIPDITAAAITAARNPEIQTPAGIGLTRPHHPRPVKLTKEPTCYICSRTKTECQRMQDWEIEHQKPGTQPLDPHVFETAEDAEANATPLTPQRKAAIMAQIATTFKNVNDLPGMKHAVEKERLAEERANAQ